MPGSAFVYGPDERVIDTRGSGSRLGPGGVLKFKFTSAVVVPTKGITAVELNVTNVNSTASSWIAAYPDGTTRPSASNLNFRAGQISPNTVVVPVGSDGMVDFYNAAGSTDLIVDFNGYYVNDLNGSFSSDPAWYVPTTPTRVLDTRTGLGAAKQPVGPAGYVTVTPPSSVIPSDDQGLMAEVVNVTATAPTQAGWIGAVESAGDHPYFSDLNFRRGQTTSNLLFIPVIKNTFALYNSAGKTQLLADAVGYFKAVDPLHRLPGPYGNPYYPLSPARLLDTRAGIGAAKRPLGTNATLRLKVAGTHGVPATATAVIINLTGTDVTSSTFLSAYSGGAVPNVSNLNLIPGETRPALATVPVDPDGYITIYNRAGNTDVVADLQGYYAP